MRILWFQVGMQDEFLEMVDEKSSHALHKAFRFTRGTRREHDNSRMVEVHLFKIDVIQLPFGYEILIIYGIRYLPDTGILSRVADDNDLLERRNSPCNFINVG